MQATLLTGCAGVGSGAGGMASINQSWEPAVDSYGDQNAAKIKPDLAECKQLAAKSVENSQAQNGGAAGGGLRSALDWARTAKNIADAARYGNPL